MSMSSVNFFVKRDSFSASPVIEMQSRPSIDLSKQPVALPGQKNSLERIREQCWERDERKTHEAQEVAKKRVEKLQRFGLIAAGFVFFPITLSVVLVMGVIGVYELICHLKEKYEERRELHALLCDSLPDGALEIPRGENVPTSDPYDFETPIGNETPQSENCDPQPSKMLLGFGVEEEVLLEEEEDADNESLFGYSGATPEESLEGEDLALDGVLDVPFFGNQEGEVEIEGAVDKAFSEEKEISSEEISNFIKNETAPSIFFQKGQISKGGLDVLVEKIAEENFYKNSKYDNLREIVNIFDQDRNQSDTQALRALIRNKKTKLEPGAEIDGLEVSVEKSLQLKNEVNLLKRLMLYIIDKL